MYCNFETMPSIYWTEAEEKGTIEKCVYDTEDALKIGRMIQKYAYVYLPFGYQRGKDYKVAYFMHGAGTDISEFLNHGEECSPMKNVLDHMIQYKDVEQMIVVFPTYYQGDYNPSNCTMEKDVFLGKYFPQELVSSLMPAVESRYCTATGRETAHRSRRGFGGFSFGGAITWEVFSQCLEQFSFFFPASGYFLDKIAERSVDLGKRVSQLAGHVENSYKEAKEFYIYAVTGEKDIAYTPMKEQIQLMKKVPEIFNEENMTFAVCENGLHNYEYAGMYLYNALRAFDWYTGGA